MRHRSGMQRHVNQLVLACSVMTGLRSLLARRASPGRAAYVIAAYVLAAGLLAPTSGAFANAAVPSDDALSLASCHGRYTAVIENTWLTGDTSDGARMRRDVIAAMMNALVAEHEEPQPLKLVLLNHRIAEKMATKSLLSAAQFDKSPRRQKLAHAQLRRMLSACDYILLGKRMFD